MNYSNNEQALVILIHTHVILYYNMNRKALAILILCGKCCMVRKGDAASLLQIEYYPELAIPNGFKISKPQAWAEKIYVQHLSLSKSVKAKHVTV